MKLISYTCQERAGVGLVRPDATVVDLTGAGIASSMLELIGAGASALDAARALIADGGAPLLPADHVVKAPIPAPRRNIFCIGKNYREHATEFGRSGFDSGAVGGDETPEHPIIFSKATTSVIGPGEPIARHLDPFDAVDYEGELAVIIGRGGRAIAGDEASAHVFGYTIVNDVTARQAQKAHKQWLLGKSIDGFCPMGPAIVTADEIGDPGALRLTTTVNGEVRQDASVRDLIFGIDTLIATISSYVTLLPGDIIATGTPAGVGIGFTPPRFLRSGDRVAVRVEPIGTLENPVS